jgi:hypothetical protein
MDMYSFIEMNTFQFYRVAQLLRRFMAARAAIPHLHNFAASPLNWWGGVVVVEWW